MSAASVETGGHVMLLRLGDKAEGKKWNSFEVLRSVVCEV